MVPRGANLHTSGAHINFEMAAVTGRQCRERTRTEATNLEFEDSAWLAYFGLCLPVSSPPAFPPKQSNHPPARRGCTKSSTTASGSTPARMGHG